MGTLNRGHERYLHFCRWLHFKSKVQIVHWSWRTEHTKILKINTSMHVPWSLDTKILKIYTSVHISWRNMWKKLKVRFYFTHWTITPKEYQWWLNRIQWLLNYNSRGLKKTTYLRDLWTINLRSEIQIHYMYKKKTQNESIDTNSITNKFF